MGRRSGVTAEETRQELLDAAMSVLLARGYEGARISAIAEEAGVTSGAIYNHFSSKAELLTAAISQHATDAIPRLLESEDVSVLDAFREAGARLPRQARRMSSLMLELVMTSTRDQEVADVVRPGFANRERVTTDVIRHAQDSGEIDPALDAEALGRFMTTFALGALVVDALEMKRLDPDGWHAVLNRMLDSMQTPVGTLRPNSSETRVGTS